MQTLIPLQKGAPAGDSASAPRIAPENPLRAQTTTRVVKAPLSRSITSMKELWAWIKSKAIRDAAYYDALYKESIAQYTDLLKYFFTITPLPTLPSTVVATLDGYSSYFTFYSMGSDNRLSVNVISHLESLMKNPKNVIQIDGKTLRYVGITPSSLVMLTDEDGALYYAGADNALRAYVGDLQAVYKHTEGNDVSITDGITTVTVNEDRYLEASTFSVAKISREVADRTIGNPDFVKKATYDTNDAHWLTVNDQRYYVGSTFTLRELARYQQAVWDARYDAEQNQFYSEASSKNDIIKILLLSKQQTRTDFRHADMGTVGVRMVLQDNPVLSNEYNRILKGELSAKDVLTKLQEIRAQERATSNRSEGTLLYAGLDRVIARMEAYVAGHEDDALGSMGTTFTKLSDLHVDPEGELQYRTTDEHEVVNKPLDIDEYDYVLGGVIDDYTWIERNSDKYIVNGHHREGGIYSLPESDRPEYVQTEEFTPDRIKRAGWTALLDENGRLQPSQARIAGAFQNLSESTSERMETFRFIVTNELSKDQILGFGFDPKDTNIDFAIRLLALPKKIQLIIMNLPDSIIETDIDRYEKRLAEEESGALDQGFAVEYSLVHRLFTFAETYKNEPEIAVDAFTYWMKFVAELPLDKKLDAQSSEQFMRKIRELPIGEFAARVAHLRDDRAILQTDQLVRYFRYLDSPHISKQWIYEVVGKSDSQTSTLLEALYTARKFDDPRISELPQALITDQSEIMQRRLGQALGLSETEMTHFVGADSRIDRLSKKELESLTQALRDGSLSTKSLLSQMQQLKNGEPDEAKRIASIAQFFELLFAVRAASPIDQKFSIDTLIGDTEALISALQTVVLTTPGVTALELATQDTPVRANLIVVMKQISSITDRVTRYEENIRRAEERDLSSAQKNFADFLLPYATWVVDHKDNPWATHDPAPGQTNNVQPEPRSTPTTLEAAAAVGQGSRVQTSGGAAQRASSLLEMYRAWYAPAAASFADQLTPVLYFLFHQEPVPSIPC